MLLRIIYSCKLLVFATLASASVAFAQAQSQRVVSSSLRQHQAGSLPSEVLNSPTGMQHLHADQSIGCDSCGMASVCVCGPIGYLFDWTRAEVFAGVVGFTGPGNFVGTGQSAQGQIEGAFGFQQGFNFGTQLPSFVCGELGSQFGMRFTQTLNEGSTASGDNRTQLFLTTGLFRRVDYGFQGGVVVDYLHDEWVYTADLLQVRGELSFVMTPYHDGGFRFTSSQQTEQLSPQVMGVNGLLPIELSALDTYRFFYRFKFGEDARGTADLEAGFAEDSSGLLSFNIRAPLQSQLGVSLSSTYLIANNDAEPAYIGEGWNLGIAFVWTPGRGFGRQHDYYRPLFDVADNGTMLRRLE